MKRISRTSDGTFIYYWQPRKRGFVGIRVGATHAWVIVGVEENPEHWLVIGPGPNIPVEPENETEEFREVRREVAAQHPELEQFLRGEISIETASATGIVSQPRAFSAKAGLPRHRTSPRSRSV
jgi:hypothetical protein